MWCFWDLFKSSGVGRGMNSHSATLPRRRPGVHWGWGGEMIPWWASYADILQVITTLRTSVCLCSFLLSILLWCCKGEAQYSTRIAICGPLRLLLPRLTLPSFSFVTTPPLSLWNWHVKKEGGKSAPIRLPLMGVRKGPHAGTPQWEEPDAKKWQSQSQCFIIPHESYAKGPCKWSYEVKIQIHIRLNQF